MEAVVDSRGPVCPYRSARQRRRGGGRGLVLMLFVIAMGGSGCGSGASDAPDGATAVVAQSFYGRGVESFTPGAGAGFGQDALPEVVLGPPDGKGNQQGSTDVVSLGVGGEIVLSFASLLIVDEAGPDLIVFENTFWAGGDPTAPFVELGEVSVSADGEIWHTWVCNTTGDGQIRWSGCAGWSPTLEYDPTAVIPLDPKLTGGDGFDLGELGVTEARFVRIRDLSTDGIAPTAGFDLDAIGVVHWRDQSGVLSHD
jgi:hypothetical protein